MPTKRPLIGCTTYRKTTSQDPLIMVDGLMPTYTGAVLAAGGLPIMIPLTMNDNDLLDLFEQLDGILLPGGGDIDPNRYGGSIDNAAVYGIDETRDHVELFLAKQAVDNDKPILAICRGHQVLNVALGGSLWEDVLELMPNAHKHAYFRGHPRNLHAHDVRIQENSKLFDVMQVDCKSVNSIHHQGVKRLGSHLTPTAFAADGLIEGIEIQDHRFAVGVQWHPEEFFKEDEQTLSLFKAFVDSAS